MRSFLLFGDLKTTHPECDMPSVSDERSDWRNERAVRH